MLKNKDDIRKRAKNILPTYINDGDIEQKTNVMKYYFRAVKYILTYGN